MKHVEEIFESFNNLSVLIVGDVMIDRYLTGKVDRISPEAPVPVVTLETTENRLGGAANVAFNVKALGARPFLCSIVGTDENGHLFRNIIEENDISLEGLITSPSRRTTVKTRVIAGSQHLLRVDSEDVCPLNEVEEKRLLESIAQIIQKHHIGAILFQDYNKGVLTPELITSVIDLGHQQGIPTIVDPKKENFLAFREVTLFKPNLKEVQEAIPIPVSSNLESLNQAAAYLNQHLGNKMTLITLSDKGLFLHDGRQGQIFPAIRRNITDVCGAGDTVVSVAAIAIAAGLPPKQIASLSNLAGGQVCEFVGVVPVEKKKLQQEYEEFLSRSVNPI